MTKPVYFYLKRRTLGIFVTAEVVSSHMGAGFARCRGAGVTELAV